MRGAALTATGNLEEVLQTIEAAAMDRELAKLAAETETHQVKSLRLGELHHLVEQDLARSGSPDPLQGVNQLDRHQLLEVASRGTFFDVFKGQLWESSRPVPGKDGGDSLEPLDAQGQPLLGDDGRPLTASEFLEELRVHPV